MCGRFVQAIDDGDLIDIFSVHQVVGAEPPPSWNVAPTRPVRAVTERYVSPGRPPARQLRTLQWGLVPSWARDASSGSRMINARSETVLDKPAFRDAAAHRRCLVPANGYYEWQRLAGRKQAYYLHAREEADATRPAHDEGGTRARAEADPSPRESADRGRSPGAHAGPLLAFAGLYEAWRDPALPAGHPDPWLRTVTILTRPATDAAGQIHDRSPVLVPRDLQDAWLNPDLTGPAEVRALLDALPEPHLVPRAVSPAVGNVAHDHPRLVEPLAPASHAEAPEGG